MHRGADCPTDRPIGSMDRRRVPSQGDRAPDGGDRLKFRVAKSQADIDLVLPLARELHEDSRFAEIPFSQDKCQHGLMRVIKARASHGFLLMAVRLKGLWFFYTARPVNSWSARAASSSLCIPFLRFAALARHGPRRTRGSRPFERRSQMGKSSPGPRDYDPCNFRHRHPPHRPLFAPRRLCHHRRQLRLRPGWGGQIRMSTIRPNLVCTMALAGMGNPGSCATGSACRLKPLVRSPFCQIWVGMVLILMGEYTSRHTFIFNRPTRRLMLRVMLVINGPVLDGKAS